MPSFLLTIDVEDWFQVENLRPWMPFSTWGSRELRVESNVHKLLDLFDGVKLDAGRRKSKVPSSSLEGNNTPESRFDSTGRIASTTTTPETFSLKPNPVEKAQATFFILGWIAERLPHLVREISARGHEVASHGSSHQMCSRLSDSDLRSELVDSKRLLEDITGMEVEGFRAPNFSVDDRVLSVLQETGYRYDSSYNSFSIHGRYGKLNLNGNHAGIAHKLTGGFLELPISNLSLFPFPALVTLGTRNFRHFRHFPLPWGGGAYFRLLPLWMFAIGVSSILKREGAYLFYIHPWEVDPGQPKVEQASFVSRFKHYKNLETTEAKLKKLIANLSHCSFVACRDYVNGIEWSTVRNKQDM